MITFSSASSSSSSRCHPPSSAALCTYDPGPPYFLLLHLAIETPAALNFLLRPSATLSEPASPSTRALIRQYGVLLLSTNFLVLFSLLQLLSPLIIPCHYHRPEHHHHGLIEPSPFPCEEYEQHGKDLVYVTRGTALQRAVLEAAMGAYHVAPLVRALIRIMSSDHLRRMTGNRRRALDGPWIHAAAHAIALSVFLGEWMRYGTWRVLLRGLTELRFW